MKILAVDDDEDILEILRVILHSGGHEVETGVNVEEGLEKVYSFMPDLILLDMMMPAGLEGALFVHRLRDEFPPKLAATPVVILSSLGSGAAIGKVPPRVNVPPPVEETLPVQGFLHKPPDPHLLLQTIAQVCSGEALPVRRSAAGGR